MRLLARVVATLLAALLLLGGTGAPLDASGSGPDATEGATVRTQVVGGDDAAADAAPWMVAVLRSGNGSAYQRQICGGTSIAQGWILTASHCVIDPTTGDPLAAEQLAVGAGSTNLDSADLVELAVTEVLVHPAAADCGPLDGSGEFTCRAPVDVALLRITPDQALATVTLARPHQRHLTAAGTPARVYGWGALDAAATSFPTRLQQAAVQLRTHEHCDANYPGVYDPSTMRCTTAPEGEPPADACVGDSGGPVVTTDERGRARQTAIVSFGTHQGCGDVPAVHLTTAAVLDWIGGVTGIVTFSDLVGTPHADAIIAIAERGLTSGRGDGTFGPDRPITRAQMASVLTRALGLPPVEADFADVPADHPHNASIGAVVAAGITSGRADGTFGPDAPVTRGQMATFLLRALDLEPVPADVADVDISHPHYHSIGAIMQAGISTGRADGTFAPSQVVTRGQIASFLTRALGIPVG